MADRVRALDWAATALGPAQGWPAAVRGAVELVLASPIVASIAIGDERRLIYNDAAARLYGDRHPAALGQPLAATFADSFPAVAPLYDRVFAGETVTVTGEPLTVGTGDGGEVFDAYLTPVRDESGAIVAAHMTGFEVGSQARSEAALRESEKRQAFLLDLSDALRPLNDTAAMEQVATQMLGKALGADHAFYATIDPGNESWSIVQDYTDGLPSRIGDYPFSAYQRTRLAQWQAGVTSSVADSENDPGLTAEGRAAYAAFGARAAIGVPLIRAGRFAALLVVNQASPRDWTDADITLVREVAERTWLAIERARTDEALRESENRYRLLFECIDEGFCLCERVPGEALDYRYLTANPAFERQSGLHDPVGKTMRELVPMIEESIMERYRQVEEGGEPARFESHVAQLDRWFEIEVTPADAPGRIAILFRDVTTRRQADIALRDSEERQKFLLKLGDVLRPLHDAANIQRAATRLMGEHLAVHRAGYYEVGDDQNTFFLTAAWEHGLPPLPDRMLITDFGDEIRDGYRAGRTMVMYDTWQETASAENLAAVKAVDIRAWIGVPLVKDGRWVAAVGVHSAVPRDWTTAEIALVEEVGDRTWAAAERARVATALAEREAELARTQRVGQVASLDVELSNPPVGHRSLEYCRLHGLPLDCSVESHAEWLARLHPEDREREDRDFQDAIMTGGTLESQYRIIRPDNGEVRWIESRGVVEHDAAGRAVRLIGAHIDITERKRADAALRDSEERMRLTVELVPVLLWSASPDGEEVDLNERWLDYTGQSEAEAQHYGWLDAIHPDELPATRAAFERAFATGEALELRHRIHKAGDGWRWHQIRHVPVRDERGTIARWFGAAFDIHENMLAEQALDESERWLQTLMEGVPQLVWRASDPGDWTWASPQWTDYTGQSGADCQGWGWLDPIHPDDREAARQAWTGAIARGEFHADYRVFHLEEERYRWFQTRALPVRDEGGHITEWLGTSTDVDDLRQLQERQKVLVAELQHRVRNVLTVVRSVFARTVGAGGEVEEIADHFRGRLDALARTQVVMTQNAAQLVDLENLIRDELLSVGAHDGTNVTIEGPDVALPAKTAESIGLAIHELTTNAVKYGALSQRGPTLSISWKINIGHGGSRRLALTWQEQGVPAISLTPARYGFGRELIEEALPYRLGAETELQFRGGGVCCSITLPLPDEGAYAADTS